METGANGHLGVCVPKHVDKARETELEIALVPRPKMEEKFAQEVT